MERSEPSDIRKVPTTKTLHFVSETGKSRPRGSFRHLIRSKASQQRQKKVARAQELPISPPNYPGDEEVSIGSSDSGGNLLVVQSPQSNYLTHVPEPIPINHFSWLPITEDIDTHFLINHYDTVYAETCIPVNPKKEWLPLALTDPALLHTTLFVSAHHLCVLKGSLMTPRVLHHKFKAIGSLNEMLRKQGIVASDALIGAVASMTQFENLMGNSKAAIVHMDGLVALVDSRGGINALPRNSQARKMTTWVDVVAAVLLETPTRFQLDSLDSDENPTTWTLYSQLALSYQNKLSYLTGSPSFSEEMIAIYWGLRNLSGLKDLTTQIAQKVEFMFFSDSLEHLQRRVLKLLQEDILKPSEDKLHLSIFMIFCNAAHLHAFLFMRDISRGLPLFHLIGARLRGILEHIDVVFFHEQYPELMLWALIMGGIGSIGTPNRIWFAHRMAEGCQRQGLHDGLAVAYKLGDFFWSELYRTPVTKDFWSDVAKAMGAESGFEVKRRGDHASMAGFNALPDMMD